jgi:hypothetical protein
VTTRVQQWPHGRVATRAAMAVALAISSSAANSYYQPRRRCLVRLCVRLEPPLPPSPRPARARRHFRPLAQRILTRRSHLAVEAPPGLLRSYLLLPARGTPVSSQRSSFRTRCGEGSIRPGTAAGSASAAPAPDSPSVGASPSPAPLWYAPSLPNSRDYGIAAVPID